MFHHESWAAFSNQQTTSRRKRNAKFGNARATHTKSGFIRCRRWHHKNIKKKVFSLVCVLEIPSKKCSDDKLSYTREICSKLFASRRNWIGNLNDGQSACPLKRIPNKTNSGCNTLKRLIIKIMAFLPLHFPAIWIATFICGRSGSNFMGDLCVNKRRTKQRIRVKFRQ